MDINIQKLLAYTKEELATYILRYCFSDKNIEENLRYTHCQLLLEKDKELTSKRHKEEVELLCQLREMPNTTIEEQAKKVKAYEKFKKLIAKNSAAYEKRQKEIDGLIERWKS